MKTVLRPGRSALLLTEIIIMLLFFALAGASCLQMFAAAQLKSDRSSDLTMAVLNGQTAAEAFRATAGDMAAMAALLDGEYRDDVVTVSYDQNWQTGAGAGTYTLTAAPRSDDGLALTEITVAKGNETLFALTTAVYTGEEAAP